ncbi:spore germination protein GerPC [Pullulanibacillus sp. KACC 23026]|uniref:spore germination protein GerPC n=1 Tax=Pullulanibacillus sp. KACC 23026 TaxID=3028315 RepID=UPI0023B01209|nr:spore germination protein GerPC [Pullulanibacillus sp. KACC 23026]WEG12332.1 spore germination protein GerPC [Pullulanibacillus sp. KACC 23026]
MAMDPNTLNHLHHLNQWIQALQERLDYAENRINQLEEKLEQLKNDKKMNVGRIEYKFDQLKIEKLDGTLNIGLTPKTGEGTLDDIMVGDSPITMTNPDRSSGLPKNPSNQSPLIQAVHDRIEAYLQHEAMNHLIRIEKEQGFPLNDPYRLFILEDIRKQIPQRLTQLEQGLQADPSTRELIYQDPDKAESLLYEEMKKEIENGTEQFILKLKSGSDA